MCGTARGRAVRVACRLAARLCPGERRRQGRGRAHLSVCVCVVRWGALAGAKLTSTLCRTFGQSYLQSLLGIFPGNEPRTIVQVHMRGSRCMVSAGPLDLPLSRHCHQPDTHVGNCWAFTGAQGHVTVALSEPISITSVTLDHLPYAHRRRDSAPRNFTVYVWVLHRK